MGTELRAEEQPRRTGLQGWLPHLAPAGLWLEETEDEVLQQAELAKQNLEGSQFVCVSI